MFKHSIPLLVVAFLLPAAVVTTSRPWAEARARGLHSGRPLSVVSTEPASTTTPTVTLFRVSPITFPATVDSNSPAFWDLVDGVSELHVLNSADGRPHLSRGPSLNDLGSPRSVNCTGQCDGRRWLESVLQDVDGTLYGFYHGEPNRISCDAPGKTAPRIGAARSRDRGYTWDDLGVILEAPSTTQQCDTPNQYFVGGVGDLSVILDARQVDVYFFFGKYYGEPSEQGLIVARMLWADRDSPQGHVAVWDAGVWRYASRDDDEIFRVPRASPVYPATISFHDPSGRVDAFWGPSVHWNTYLEQYVMLLNRSNDSTWTTEGIYVAFSPVLDDPSRWTVPQKVRGGGSWYPQVIGLEQGLGTDKLAGQVARFFIGGYSQDLIVFQRGR